MKSRLVAGLLVIALLVAGSACTSLPAVDELPEAGSETRVETLPQEGETAAEAQAGPGAETVETAPEAELPVKRLRLEDVRGGELDFELPGRPEEVAAALLDFAGASGHRAWAPLIEALPARGETLLSRWHFEGEMGIDPVVVLGFREKVDAESRLIRFKIVERDFGLAAFFGDYRIRASATDAGRSRVRARIFIDSGVTIANASDEEIAAGLREDARMLESWMKERLAVSR